METQDHETATGWVGAFLGLLLGAVIGGFAGFLLPEPYYQLTKPQILKDGQWGMVYLSTIPTGIVLGSGIGTWLGWGMGKRV